MVEVDFETPRDGNLQEAPQAVERVCSEFGLTLSMKGTLATYPGSIHWHYRYPNLKGTLELTLHTATHRLWAKVQSGRRAPWIERLLPDLRLSIESALRNHRQVPTK